MEIIHFQWKLVPTYSLVINEATVSVTVGLTLCLPPSVWNYAAESFFSYIIESFSSSRVTSVKLESMMCKSNMELIHTNTWCWLLTKLDPPPPTSHLQLFFFFSDFLGLSNPTLREAPRPRFNRLWHLILERPSLFGLHFTSTHCILQKEKKRNKSHTGTWKAISSPTTM